LTFDLDRLRVQWLDRAVGGPNDARAKHHRGEVAKLLPIIFCVVDTDTDENPSDVS
jgi:hypothetical protein